MDFQKSYNKLNAAQKAAVDNIDGPVLVVAGPGTGKTQLLSMRAANIVRQTDAAPQNILCLTFTESGAANMRQRLIELMGTEGNGVCVHTFHSFGSDIINRYREYFYNGAQFEPADDLASYQILQEIFEDLQHNSPLASKMNDEFTALKDTQKALSSLKRAGLLPEELLAILDHNQEFCDALEPQLSNAFANRFSKKDFPRLAEIGKIMNDFSPKNLSVAAVKPLAFLCGSEFSQALEQAEETGKTNPLTAWRNRWLEKNHIGQHVFKDRRINKKLREVAKIFQKYSEQLMTRQLFDFDDMISTVAHTLEKTNELRFNLQEQFLYIMVDEFQDTNGAQLRLLNALTDNPVNENRPNILAVGDDDQAIYSFQGAELSNILDFKDSYHDVKIITLTDNYRSSAEILNHSRNVITLGAERLENTLQNVCKHLNPQSQIKNSTTEIHFFETPSAENNWVANQVLNLLNNDHAPQDIAILARKHNRLMDLAPYLHQLEIPLQYERRSDVLQDPQIKQIITMARAISCLQQQQFDLLDSYLPQILTYDFWELNPKNVYQLSLNAYKQRRFWLELMLEDEGKLRQIAEFFILGAHFSQTAPLDSMLDYIIGAAETHESEDFTSPFKTFHFNEQKLKDRPTEYMQTLNNLHTLRSALQNWQTDDDKTPSLATLIDFVNLRERTNMPISDLTKLNESGGGVTLMTAHKAKGLEFKTVFVLSCQDEVWSKKAVQKHSTIKFPHNLPIEPAGANYDDMLRLFYVAMTRAKQNLLLTSHKADQKGKPNLLAEFLNDHKLAAIEHQNEDAKNLAQLLPGWEQAYYNLPRQDMADFLKPLLQNYKLSATHVNNFIDITRGGPQAFLLQNLLRFPQAMTPNQVFGTAIHAALQHAHAHLSVTGERRPTEDILHDFELQLQNSRLSERDINYLSEKGSDVLQNYLLHRYNDFSVDQKSERNFANQHIIVNNVPIKGVIDLMQVDDKAKVVTVTDYKTGKPASSWSGKTDYDKIKLHKYKQQLMFYKLLIENSSDFKGYTVERGVLEFIEADGENQLHHLTLAICEDDLTEFKKLLKAVWQKIQDLNFWDTSNYEPSYNGILRFEQDLINS